MRLDRRFEFLSLSSPSPIAQALTTDECSRSESFLPATWVKLVAPLSLFCHDEAMLLCQVSHSEWVAWIPDLGEVTLHASQFYLNDWN